MTPSEQKDLATWAAEFLGGKLEVERVHAKNIYTDEMLAYVLFERTWTSPILMHLAKREMEKQGFNHTVSCTSGEYTVFIHPPTDSDKITHIENENEFIAFWSAVREAVEG